jgi:hypothetical protein
MLKGDHHVRCLKKDIIIGLQYMYYEELNSNNSNEQYIQLLILLLITNQYLYIFETQYQKVYYILYMDYIILSNSIKSLISLITYIVFIFEYISYFLKSLIPIEYNNYIYIKIYKVIYVKFTFVIL